MTNIILLGIFIQIIPVFISQQRLSKRVTLLQRAARFNFVVLAVCTSNSLNFNLMQQNFKLRNTSQLLIFQYFGLYRVLLYSLNSVHETHYVVPEFPPFSLAQKRLQQVNWIPKKLYCSRIFIKVCFPLSTWCCLFHQK